MKKLLSVLIAILIMCSAFTALSAFAAEKGYKSGDIITLSFTADEINRSFTGLEGELNFDPDEIELNEDSVEFPHISDAMYNITESTILFNATDTDNYDISPDRVIIKADFRVKSDIEALHIETLLNDIYYRDGTVLKDFDNITLPYTLKMYDVEPPIITEDTTAALTEAASTGQVEGTTSTSPVSTDPVSSEATKSTSPAESTASTKSTDSTVSTEATNTSEISTQATEPTETTPPAEKEKQTITAKSFKKTYGNKKFALNAKTSGNGTLTYKSSKTGVAAVSSDGTVTIKGSGKATITIMAEETSIYKAASKKITVTVNPAKVKILKKSAKGNKVAFKLKKQPGVSGYQVDVSLKSNYKPKLKTKLKSSKTKVTISGVARGKKNFVRIRAYAKSGKTKIYSAWKKCSIKTT